MASSKVAIWGQFFSVFVWLHVAAAQDVELITDEIQARNFLNQFNKEVQIRGSRMAELNWKYSTNLTDYNREIMTEYKLEYTKYWAEVGQNISMFNVSAYPPDLERQLEALEYIGSAALNDNETIVEYNTITNNARALYSKGKVCKWNNKLLETCLPLDPDLTAIMKDSRNYNDLYGAWKGWRDAVGAPAKQEFIRKVEIQNEIATANGYDDLGAVWRSNYEVDDLEKQAEKLYNQLRPLYENFHAYVRRKLYKQYGDSYVNLKGPIPAHLLGNMWAQTWGSLNDLLEPYPGKPAVDITDDLKRKNYTALQMFEVAEEFFTSLGLLKMPPEFWNHSMIEKPEDREVVCHASAWDFGNTKDFRIKMCTDINMDEFVTIHHEMGHTQYQMLYKDLPWVYRGGANPGFHEAIGDTLALSVATPKHLHAVGLLDELQEDDESDLNFLMLMAAEKIAFLPFGYLMDQWRWAVFNGTITPDQYNTKWWELRTKYQGIVPPLKRTEDDFDPAAKYHIANDVAYIRYFISFVIQFQFHQALCNVSNNTGPLHRCDIYRSKEAGTLISNMMKMGSSKPWPDAMEVMTGQREFDASALMEYFQPLTDWLIAENKRNNEVIGWPDAQWAPPDPFGAAAHIAASTAVIVVSSCLVLLLHR